MKLASLLAMTCLFLAAGMSMEVGHASAHQAQSAKKFRHWSAQAPHITIKMIPSTSAHPVSRFVISGVGFTTCCPSASNSYNTCSNSCGASSPAASACDNGCGSTTPTTSSNPCDTATCTTTTSQTSSTDTNVTTTTTTTSTTNPSVTTYSISTPSTTSQASVPSNSSQTSVPSDTCPSYDPCGNTSPSSPDTSATNNGSTDCSCNNTVDLQSSVPASAPGVNLTRIPVNAFGEFNVTVNVHPHRILTKHYTIPTFWAINSYNDQPSNYASASCTCSYCCQ